MSHASRAWKGITVLGIGLAALVGIGVVPRLKQRDALAQVQKDLAAPRRVRVVSAKAGNPKSDITLPGTTAPFHSSMLYAKSTGFVRKNLVDVGDHVKAGQVLTQIDAPETAQDVRLAQARLEEAEANVSIAQTTADRAKNLVAAGVVSQQQSDDTRAQANSAIASVQTRRAELSRLHVLRGYEQIIAPFDGVITRRGTDPGALVGPAGSGGVALFEVADIEMLRVYVDVPDAYAGDVKVDLEAKVFSPRAPTQKIIGKVVRTSGVLEQASRTLRVEINVRGDGAAVMPGAFVYVDLGIPRAKPSPTIPASALLIRKEGTLVAKVRSAGDTNVLTITPVVLGRDYGKELEILDGVAVNDQVVINASDDLESGQKVEIVPLPAPPTASAK